jgi:hypothetical protein
MVIYADQQPGTTADVKLNACIQAAINRPAKLRFGGGICDARGLYGKQIIANQVNVGDRQQNQVTLLLPTFATWLVTVDDERKCGIKQYGNSAIIGADSGGSNQMTIEAAGAPGQKLDSLYCTDGTPLRGGSYVRAEGFQIYNPSGTFMNSAAMTVQFTFDNSTFKEISIADYGNVGLLVHGSCCGTSFWNVTSNSNYGLSTQGDSTRALPVQIKNDDISGTGYANPGVSFYSLSADHPSVGQNCISISGAPDPYYVGDTLQFHNLYMEGSEADSNTPLVRVDAPLSAVFWGVTASRRATGSTAYAFEVSSSFRSQFQVFGFTFFNDSSGGANGPVVNDHINAIHAKADASGNLAFYSTAVSPTVRQTLVTTAATSTSLRINGVSSTSRCSISAANALAATYITRTYIMSRSRNEIVVSHAAVAGMTYDIVCTAY